MFKNLIRAYNSFMQGIYAPELLALNPSEWEWMVKMYYPYQEETGNIVTSHILDEEHFKCPEWGLFKGGLFVMKDSIPPGEVWMWRFEPKIMFKKYNLLEGKSVTLRFDFDFSMMHVSASSNSN